ncbi:MAG: hypothetical protein U1E65_15315 [Myxococcota bacterium]
MIRRLLLGSLALTAACSGGASAPVATARAALTPTTEEVRLALAPVCGPCHLQGQKAFFQSARTFEDLLVYEPRYVSPGHPESSELIALLEGNGSGVFRQMPTAGPNYAAMAAADASKMSVAAIRDWISGLGPRTTTRDERADPSAMTVRRLGAEQIKAILYRELGLDDSDFFSPGENFGIPTFETRGEDNYPLHGPDEINGYHSGDASRSGVRHFALGGRSGLANRKRDPAITPAFVQALVPLSQRWCRMSAAKGAASPLFTEVRPGDRVEAQPAATRAQIIAWHRTFLGERPSSEEVDHLVADLLVPLQAESDPTSAWVGLCSYFIRHPRFLFY